VAEAVLFLMNNGFVTGAVLPIDGGRALSDERKVANFHALGSAWIMPFGCERIIYSGFGCLNTMEK